MRKNTLFNSKNFPAIELPTLGIILCSYAIWFLLVTFGSAISLPLWVLLFSLNVTFFLSITHEVIHRHPTRNPFVNRLLMLFPLGWVFPYERFRDTHLQHHQTNELTDPFDDPESWYYAQSAYQRMNWLMHTILTFNNTLFGRMLIGPLISVSKFYTSELGEIIYNKEIRIYLLKVWSGHILLCALLAAFIYSFSSISAWTYVVGVYFGLSVLLIRTFLEHQAVEDHAERTVIIEKSCPLAFLFLFNNLHVVHHENPGTAWYELPRIYRNNSEAYKKLNNHYIYSSYGEIFRKYFLMPKEKIPHPFLRDVRS